MALLDLFRERKDQFFRTDPHSPLLPEQQDTFSGLAYFPENTDLRFELLIEEFPDQETVVMQTSTGSEQEYIRYGKIHFEVEGQPAELTVYLAQGGGGFFLPFMDSTNGDETYDAGRYLDIEPMTGEKYLVDFNLAYNPYCAYNPPRSLYGGELVQLWSCPIPPKENRLSVPIRAGEKKPTGSWVDEGQ